MDLPNVKELEKLLKMCRKQGITELTMGNMSFKFGDLPKDYGTAEEEAAVPNLPSDEELMFYSVMPGANEQ